MKTKRIWIWSFIFALFAASAIYVVLFTNTAEPASSAKEYEEEETDVTEEEELLVETGRIMNNPIIPVEEGKRAISLEIREDFMGVSGYIEPESYVDIVAYYNSLDEKEKKEFISAEIILQNVKVLASGGSHQRDDEALQYTAVTVEVTPEEGVLLSLVAKEENGFYFMLRNDEDTEISSDPVIETREIWKGLEENDD